MKLFNIISLAFFSFLLSQSLYLEGVKALNARKFVPVCKRTPQVRDAIVAALETPCEKIKTEELATITNLLLSNKKIKHLRPGDFDGLEQLYHLILSGNGLREIPQDIFLSTPNLGVLDLSHNYLSEATTSILNGLQSKLQHLDVQNNHIHTLILEGFTNLEDIFADDNHHIREISFKDIPNATFVTLENNGLENIDFGLLELSKLEELDISFNYLESVDGLEKLAHLKEVSLFENRLKNFPMELLRSNVKSLDLRFNRIGHIPRDISPYGKVGLEELSLHGNPLLMVPRWITTTKGLEVEIENPCKRMGRYLLSKIEPKLFPAKSRHTSKTVPPLSGL